MHKLGSKDKKTATNDRMKIEIENDKEKKFKLN